MNIYIQVFSPSIPEKELSINEFGTRGSQAVTTGPFLVQYYYCPDSRTIHHLQLKNSALRL